MSQNTGDIFLLETLKSLKGLKSTAEKAIMQISEEEMFYKPDEESNSVAVLIRHIAGNMISRFTDFLTTDGEKPWRNRDSEFTDEKSTSEILMKRWNEGWQCTFDSLEKLSSADLEKEVLINNEKHTVIRALTRHLVHYAYHTGQIVYLCKQIRSTGFKTLSIPKKKSAS
jgi:hypothetical protein